MPTTRTNRPADYLTAAQLAEAHQLYETLAGRIRSNLRARLRLRGDRGPAVPHIHKVRTLLTASVQIEKSPDTDVTGLHHEWLTVAELARRETDTSTDLAARLVALAEQLLTARNRAAQEN